MCDLRVLLGQYGGGNTLYVFDVNKEHTLSAAGNVTLEWFYGLACTRRGNDTLVAFTHESSVSLQRLASFPLRLEQLASVNVTDAWRLLFRGDLLLVAQYNITLRSDAILSFRVSGNTLTEQRVLLDSQAGVDMHSWALAGERLILATPYELLEYNFTSNGE